jgi:ferrous iron transport protein A
MLHEAKAGDRCVVAGMRGSSRFRSRAVSIGLTVGAPVEIVRNQKRAPLLVFCRDSMIAVNRIDAESILVEVNR